MKKNRLLRLFSFMWKDGGNFLLGISYLISMLVMASQNFGFNYIAAMSLKAVTDGMINKDQKLLIEGAIYMAKGFGILLITLPIFGYIYQYTIRKTTMNIREKVFNHIINLPMGEFEKRHSGDFLSRLNYDINTAEGAYSWQIMILLTGIISAIGGITIIFSINRVMFLYAIVTGLLNVFINVLFMKPLRRVSEKIQESFSRITQKLSDTIGGAFIIRSFNIGKLIFEKFVELNTILYRLALKRVKYNSLLASFNYSIGYLIYFGELVVGGILIMDNKMSFGNLVATVQLMGLMSWFFGSIGNFLSNLQVSLAGAERLFEILDLPLEEDLYKEIKVAERKDYAKEDIYIRFKNVSFSYDGNQPVLRNISFEIEKNKKTAFVGPSGGGKSTIFKLLLGFYPSYDGKIEIFGKELREYSIEELRDLISYVPQDVYLFNGTIYENVRYGKLNATDEEIIEALKKANAYDFVIELPEGLNTKVGERGLSLSGGQRQRIAIARAILKNSPILLLDEATSSLDSESEKLVTEALERLTEGRTTLIIAHRLSTIENCDLIYVVDNGEIREKGDHRTLLSMNGKYKALWEIQF
ncbi:MAG TPA: ABC transporter ATP-binding protein [Dictyoglomaceae bacterium]|nr:ABC transporter ATP-binding protein [Dictyoglomaceae bacterium]HOL39894.1 ABC transporter ATP-binding protein [Dictyoglomaceae bacterium]HOP95288.1 ABC transporter ATP-binding protein [Dictyoglomaceae bacterium]HPP16282.1 ABC transporter ATP-binding protein [Dictyoglomaceae bacterium]HPU43255.1 ABC transporter ATP-binding protein [Dictyoglomaceae bacterium]